MTLATLSTAFPHKGSILLRGMFTHQQYRRLCDAIEEANLGQVTNSMCTEEKESTFSQIALYTGSDEETLEALVRSFLTVQELTVHVPKENNHAKKTH